MSTLDRLCVPLNAIAMIVNVIVFSATGSWFSAFAAVFTAAMAGWCQWHNRQIMQGD